ncbi:MAG TPA: hypothetical protein VFC51_09865 [Chloroflexota bacterium]|nr:hypothetical protein [Chloroflexota bacterium]
MSLDPLGAALHIVVFVLGATISLAAVLSAVRSFVLPRSAPDRLARWVFRATRSLFGLWIRGASTYEEVDGRMALYAPLSLLLLPIAWLATSGVGYMAMYWAMGVGSVQDAFVVSGSSLLTLGFARPGSHSVLVLSFTEAAIGLILVALLISYLPAMYGAFSRRESAVTLLEVRAGSPPSAVELIQRYHRLRRFDYLHTLWSNWEQWFAELEETHTSLPALVFFRSPRSEHSWITAAGTVLDAASLVASSIAVPRDAQADLCIRAGYIALRHIADYFGLPYHRDPKPGDPISVSRREFDEALDRLAGSGVPINADRDQAWRDFAGWRVNYDTPLLTLANLTLAPYAPWSSDRGPIVAD